MRVAVVSGKGGAGKTSVAVSLVLARGEGLIVDCDVEEPNVSVLLNPRIEGKDTVYRPNPAVNEERCNFCGTCADACQFGALLVLPRTVLVFEKMCHSCGTCVYVCPNDAMCEVERSIGEIEWGRVGSIEYMGGRLKVGEAMPTFLVARLKDRIPERDFIVLDAPPGVTCPVVEALKGSDFVLVVAESSPFGVSDVQGVLEYVSSLNVPYGVLENKAGMCGELIVERFCKAEGVPYMGSIPYSEEVCRAYARGVPMVSACEELRPLFEELISRMEDAVS